jgi:hypothetical protein
MRGEALLAQGDISASLGDVDGARAAWTQAADVLHQFGSPEADTARHRLDTSLSHPTRRT